MNAERAGEKYRPSNGTEGDLFIGAWCHQCQYIACPIVGLTMAYSVEDDEYPEEWQYAHDGQPCCTAFVDAVESEPVPPTRCPLTVDMFEQGGAA